MNLKRRIELAWFRARGGFPGNLNGEKMVFMPEDRKFWRKVSANKWEPQTFAVLDRFLTEDSVYLDVGAWIGPTVLYAARHCREVYCLEPDPVAYEQLLAHLRMNDIRNVQTFHGALGTAMEVMQISNEGEMGNSETQVVKSGNGAAPAVLALPIRQFVKWWGIEKIDLLKVDVEGDEFALIPDLIDLVDDFKPTVYLSLHAPNFPEQERPELLGSVIPLAKRYQHCLDRNLEPISPESLEEYPYTDKFREIVLCDQID